MARDTNAKAAPVCGYCRAEVPGDFDDMREHVRRSHNGNYSAPPPGVIAPPATDAGEMRERVTEVDLWKSVNMADREAAARAGYALGVPDVQGPRQQEILAREFARFRLALLPAKSYREGIEEAAREVDSWQGRGPGDQHSDAVWNVACTLLAAAIRDKVSPLPSPSQPVGEG